MRICDWCSDVVSSDLCCPLRGAPHSGDHDAEYHGDLTEQHVRPLHDLASDFSCAFSSWKARNKDVPQASGSVTGQCRSKTVLSRKVAEKERMSAVARHSKTPQAHADSVVPGRKIKARRLSANTKQLGNRTGGV